MEARLLSARPAHLEAAVAALAFLDDRADRIQALIDIAGRYRDVPAEVATRPFEVARHVPGCESEAYVWALPRQDGTLDFHIAVENPQGVTARALAVLLVEGASGAPLASVMAIDAEIVHEVFGSELSIGKTMGLTGIVEAVRGLAAEHALEARAT